MRPVRVASEELCAIMAAERIGRTNRIIAARVLRRLHIVHPCVSASLSFPVTWSPIYASCLHVWRKDKG